MPEESAKTLWLLQESCCYNPVTGELAWIKSRVQSRWWNNRYAGKPAFSTKQKDGRKRGKFRQQTYEASRVAWALYTGAWPKGDVDHRDGDTGNNRILNLKDGSSSHNMLNCKLAKNNKTGYTGVYKCRGKYKADGRQDGKTILIGTFDTKEEAYAARVAWYKERGVAMLDRIEL